MAYLVHERAVQLIGVDKEIYTRVRAFAREMPGGTWEGWLEFITDAGGIVATDRETTQSHQQDVAFWAHELEANDLNQALGRALEVKAR